MSDYGEMSTRLRDREKHDYTLAELNDLRAAHEALLAVVREIKTAAADSVRIQHGLIARLSRLAGEAEGRPRVAPSDSKLDLHDSTRR